MRTWSPRTVTGIGTTASMSSTVISSLAWSIFFTRAFSPLNGPDDKLDDRALDESFDRDLRDEERLDLLEGRLAVDEPAGLSDPFQHLADPLEAHPLGEDVAPQRRRDEEREDDVRLLVRAGEEGVGDLALVAAGGLDREDRLARDRREGEAKRRAAPSGSWTVRRISTRSPYRTPTGAVISKERGTPVPGRIVSGWVTLRAKSSAEVRFPGGVHRTGHSAPSPG